MEGHVAPHLRGPVKQQARRTSCSGPSGAHLVGVPVFKRCDRHTGGPRGAPLLARVPPPQDFKEGPPRRSPEPP